MSHDNEINTRDLPPAIFLMGPTASGKTDLAVRLCQDLPCEIISVDSALVYRTMDIGTAKPDRGTLAKAPHRLIDIIDPSEAYSAAQFRADALQAMTEITEAGGIPLLVGGTMLYFRALQQGLSELPSADPQVRARLEQQQQQLGLAAMHARLAEVDPEAAQRIHQNDPQRILRALEVYEISGRSMSELYDQQQGEQLPYRVVKVVVAPTERVILHQRIAQRFHTMLEQGFVAEVERLFQRGDLGLELPAIRAVGYRQVWEYLEGRYDYETMVHKAIVATRQLAKRQFTWLRSESDAYWLESTDTAIYEELLKLLNEVSIT